MKTQLSIFESVRYLSLRNDFYIGRSLHNYGEWSYGEVNLLKKVLAQGGNILEAGSNIGAHSVPLAREVCGDGQLFAFEPRRVLFQLLCANLALNNVENAHAFQLALGDAPGELFEGKLETEASVNAGAYELTSLKGNSERISVTTIDLMLDRLPQISLLKADIEGYELKMLKGGEGLIERDRPVIYLENDRPERARQLMLHIDERGYRIWEHIVMIYRPDNIAGSTVDIFPQIGSRNILCVPLERVDEDIPMTEIAASEKHLLPVEVMP